MPPDLLATNPRSGHRAGLGLFLPILLLATNPRGLAFEAGLLLFLPILLLATNPRSGHKAGLGLFLPIILLATNPRPGHMAGLVFFLVLTRTWVRAHSRTLNLLNRVRVRAHSP